MKKPRKNFVPSSDPVKKDATKRKTKIKAKNSEQTKEYIYTSHLNLGEHFLRNAREKAFA